MGIVGNTSLPFNLVFSVEILPIFVVGTKMHSLPRLDCTWNLGEIRWGLFEIFIQMCLALKSLQFSSLYSGTSLWFYIEGSQNIQNCFLTKDWESLTLISWYLYFVMEQSFTSMYKNYMQQKVFVWENTWKFKQIASKIRFYSRFSVLKTDLLFHHY